MQPVDNKVAGGIAVSAGSFITSWLPQINLWLQFAVLVLGVAGAVYTLVLLRKRHKIIQRDFTDTGRFKAFMRDDLE